MTRMMKHDQPLPPTSGQGIVQTTQMDKKDHPTSLARAARPARLAGTSSALLLAACLLVTLLGGCATGPAGNDAVSVYRRKHPAEAAKYVYIYPISTDTYTMIASVQSGTVLGIATTLRQKFSDVPQVVRYAETIVQEEAAATQNRNSYFDSLRVASLDGGVICEFESYDGKATEIGLMVLRAGEIVKRDVWRTEQGGPPAAGKK